MHRLLFCLFVGSLLFASPSSAASAVSADDVCAPTADPCVVAQPIDVEAGAHLDFGGRALRIEGAGLLDFADGRGAVSCGRFETATAGPAIRSRAVSSSAVSLVVEARRLCSGARRPCLVDADCDGGGVCSQGDGTMDLRGGILGSSEAPGSVVLRSAGDLALRAPVALAGTRSISDGGSLALESTQGNVAIEDAIDLSGGGGGCGGDVSVVASGDVRVHAPIDASGGEYDGGWVMLDAGRDVTIGADIAVDARSGAGAGGEIDVVAGRDIVAEGEADASGVAIRADGHQSAEYEGGDGGAVSFEADGSIRIARDVRFLASAAAPDGFADSLSLSAGIDLVLDGTVVAKGRGSGGAGALADLSADRDVRIGSDAVLELTGSAAGGDFMVEAGGAFSADGFVDVSGGASGLGGRIVTVAGGDTRIGGTWTTAGAESDFTIGEVFVEGCRVLVDASITNAAAAGRNRFVARESLWVGGQAAIVASGEGGSNSFTQRTDGAEPQIFGAVAPAPAVLVDSALAACAACDDAAIEENVHATTMRVRPGDAPGEDAVAWKARFAAGLLPAVPEATSLHVIVSDALARPLVEVALPAGALVRGRAGWRFTRSDEEPTVVQKLSIDASDRDGLVRVRARLDGLELPDTTTAASLRLALRFGVEPDEQSQPVCLSSPLLECRSARGRLSCATPR